MFLQLIKIIIQGKEQLFLVLLFLAVTTSFTEFSIIARELNILCCFGKKELFIWVSRYS